MPDGQRCCICDKPLPNRYAVAGRCETDACERAFCHLHWRRGNRLCREHGFKMLDGDPPADADAEPTIDRETTSENEPMNDARETDEKQPASSAETPVAKKSWIKLDPKKAKRMMSATVQFVGRMGAGAAGLLGRLKKDASPEAMLATLSAAAEANRARREETSARLDERQAAIVRLKKAYESASPVRKRILQAELKTALAHYKATEREVGTLLENEQVLAQAVGRIHEMAAYDMAGVSEDALDDLAVDIDSRVDDAEARLDAARDLEKAGRRRNRESDAEDLWEQLAEFDEQATPETDDFERELAGFDDAAGDRESAREAPPKKAAPPRPETEG